MHHVQTQGLLAPGQSASVTVTPSKGSYDIYCGVPGHKQQGSGGLLTGDATNPGTAPLFVLLALAIWPVGSRPWPVRNRRKVDSCA